MTLYRITHITSYQYKNPVTLSHNEVYLIPRNLPWQNCRRYDIKIDPKPSVYDKTRDFFGNHSVYFAIQYPHDRMRVKSVSVVQRDEPAQVDFSLSTPWKETIHLLSSQLSKEIVDARQFMVPSPSVSIGTAFKEYANPSFEKHDLLLEAVFDFMHRIFQDFTFDPAATTIATPVEEVLQERHGVCQDFSHLAISCLRSFGIPARYVSGYLETLPPPGQPRLVGADASHAWFSVFDPKMGWVDFDPTNDQVPNAKHITVAWGRDYRDVAPLRGLSLGGEKQTFEVSVDMEPLETDIIIDPDLGEAVKK